MPRITNLPVASSVGASDLVVIVQANVTKRATVALLEGNGNTDANFGNLTVNGILTVIGNSNLSANANVVGNLTVIGTANLSGNATVGGNLTVTGNQTLAGNANFSGTLTVAGNANLAANANVGGNLIVLGTSNISGNERVGGILTVAGNANLQANANIGGNLTVTGTITPGQTTGIVGTTTNNNVQAGSVGESVSSVQGAASVPTSGQYGDLTSISLTAGDWDVTGMVQFNANGATVTVIIMGISTTSGNSSTGLTAGSAVSNGPPPVVTYDVNLSVPPLRFSLSGTTTIYLKYFSTYTVAVPLAAGRLSARRAR